jgi:hypothetical protein
MAIRVEELLSVRQATVSMERVAILHVTQALVVLAIFKVALASVLIFLLVPFLALHRAYRAFVMVVEDVSLFLRNIIISVIASMELPGQSPALSAPMEPSLFNEV